jgi:hypothetical protein
MANTDAVVSQLLNRLDEVGAPAEAASSLPELESDMAKTGIHDSAADSQEAINNREKLLYPGRVLLTSKPQPYCDLLRI